jgi:hypothetical protein
MSYFRPARLVVAVAMAATLVGCSSQSPVVPGELPSAPGGGRGGGGGSTGVPGVYALSFWAWQSGIGLHEVSSLPVLSAELNLKAQVTDTAGNPAAAGTVTFEYCSYGKPTNDITRPDEAPMEDCEPGGTATWIALRRATRVNDGTCVHLGNASACTNFGIVRIPRTVGFRFRYDQKGGSIASGMSPARNFVWTAQLP